MLSALCSYDYLWNEVRVKGGAYGTGLGVNRNGNLVCNSYRDPDPLESLKISVVSAKPVIQGLQ